MSRDPEAHYAIRARDTDGHQCIEFWSARRLSFDNKRDAEKRLISDLAKRLQLLHNTAGYPRNQWLRAVFASDDPIDCDAGNLTYLNIGTRPFAGLAAKISFERWQ